MTEIRLVKQEEMKTAAELSDAIFAREPGMASMAQAFPILFSAVTSHSLGLFEDAELRVFMGLVPSRIRIGQARLSVLSAGSVFTVEEARNRGYASRVLREAITYGRKAGASLLLISGDGPLYTRSGCRPFGTACRYIWSRELIRPSEQEKVCGYRMGEVLHEELLHLQELAEKRRVAYEQSVWDLPALLQAEANVSGQKLRQRVFAARAGGKVAAYVAAALPGPDNSKAAPYIVEYAGEPDVILTLLSYILDTYGLEQLAIIVGAHEISMREALSRAPSESIRNQGTVYILDQERLILQLRPFLEAIDPAAGRDLILTAGTGEGAVLSLPGLPDVPLTRDQLVSLIFDPRSELPLPPEWAELANRMFPVPFPYTGGLNFV